MLHVDVTRFSPYSLRSRWHSHERDGVPSVDENYRFGGELTDRTKSTKILASIPLALQDPSRKASGMLTSREPSESVFEIW